MKNPNPVNLQTSEEIRRAGWQAETRDADGHLCRTHVPFDSDEDIIWLVREALEHGETVTIWPVANPEKIERHMLDALKAIDAAIATGGIERALKMVREAIDRAEPSP